MQHGGVEGPRAGAACDRSGKSVARRTRTGRRRSYLFFVLSFKSSSAKSMGRATYDILLDLTGCCPSTLSLTQGQINNNVTILRVNTGALLSPERKSVLLIDSTAMQMRRLCGVRVFNHSEVAEIQPFVIITQLHRYRHKSLAPRSAGLSNQLWFPLPAVLGSRNREPRLFLVIQTIRTTVRGVTM